MSKNQLRRKSDWPFPPEDYIVKVNPVGNSTAKDYTADFYQSDVPATIPQVKDAEDALLKELNKYLVTGEYIQNIVSPTIEADPSGGSLNEPGKKADAGKILPWLFLSGFARALEETAKVTTLGAKKYTPGGWATVPDGVNRYMEAAMRHMLALGKGKVLDDGIGGLGVTYHKSQIIWNILASLELELQAMEIASIEKQK